MAISPENSPPEFDRIAQSIQQAAQQREGNCLELLALLRLIEQQHQTIRESLFRDALPDNRQILYSLLRDIEVNGGWPYIQRMKLAEFLTHFENEPEETPEA